MRRLIWMLLLALPAGNVFAQTTGTIPVVNNERQQWRRGQEWRVAERPAVDTGTAEGAPEYELSTIRGILRLNDGTIVVANQQTELRYYDRNGTYIRTAGRRGEGPGEFFQIQGLTLLRDGNIGVDDFRHGIQVYSPEGKFIRRYPMPNADGFPPLVVFDDGTMILGDWPQGRRGATAIHTDSMELRRFPPGGPEQIVGRFPAVRFAPTSLQRSQHMQFSPVLMQFARGQSWYLGFPEKWEVMQLTATGKPVRLIRRAWQPIEITAADRQAYRTTMVNQVGEGGGTVSPRMRAQREALYADDMFAKTLPAYGGLYVDAIGNLWTMEPLRPRDMPTVARFNDTNDKPRTWSVFEPSGKWLGQVQTPGNFLVFDIGADYIIGLWRDEFDVEHVRLYTLIKPR